MTGRRFVEFELKVNIFVLIHIDKVPEYLQDAGVSWKSYQAVQK